MITSILNGLGLSHTLRYAVCSNLRSLESYAFPIRTDTQLLLVALDMAVCSELARS